MKKQVDSDPIESLITTRQALNGADSAAFSKDSILLPAVATENLYNRKKIRLQNGNSKSNFFEDNTN